MQPRPPGARLRPSAPAPEPEPPTTPEAAPESQVKPRQSATSRWRSGPALGLYGALAGVLATVLVGGVASWQSERNFYVEQRVDAYGQFLTTLGALAQTRPELVEAAPVPEDATSDADIPLEPRTTEQSKVYRDFEDAAARVRLVGSDVAIYNVDELTDYLRDPVAPSGLERHSQYMWRDLERFQTVFQCDLRPTLDQWLESLPDECRPS